MTGTSTASPGQLPQVSHLAQKYYTTVQVLDVISKKCSSVCSPYKMSSWKVLCRETMPLPGSCLQRTSQPVTVSKSAWHHVNRQGPEQQPFEPLLSHCLPAAVAAVLTLSHLVSPQPVLAADTVKVGTCLLQKCQLQLAECLGDPVCLQDIVCLNLCNTAKDEAACQIRWSRLLMKCRPHNLSCCCTALW